MLERVGDADQKGGGNGEEIHVLVAGCAGDEGKAIPVIYKYAEF